MTDEKKEKSGGSAPPRPPVYTEAKARALAARLLPLYCDLCDTARIAKGASADLIGVSRSRMSQMRKECTDSTGPNLNTAVFLSLYKAVQRLQAGLSEGWLPAKGRDADAQDMVYALLLEDR